MWGADTQLRLRSAKLLIINLSGVGTEIVKNLVLGGLNTIEILDPSTVKEEDFATQFFLPNDDAVIGKPKLPLVISAIKELNPRVNLLINTSSISDLSPDYFKNFDLVVATELSKSEILALNAITRHQGIPLYVAGLHGLFGYIFTDLIKHESRVESEMGNQPRVAGTKINDVKTIVKVEAKAHEKKEIVTIVDTYVPIGDILTSKKLPSQLNKRQLKRFSAALPLIFSLFELERPSNPEDVIDINLLKNTLLKVCARLGLPESVISDHYLHLFSNQAFVEFAPVAAILGGLVAQDVIQYLGRKESPINNCLILNSDLSEVPIFYL